jgi:hypothetical protein
VTGGGPLGPRVFIVLWFQEISKPQSRSPKSIGSRASRAAPQNAPFGNRHGAHTYPVHLHHGGTSGNHREQRCSGTKSVGVRRHRPQVEKIVRIRVADFTRRISKRSRRCCIEDTQGCARQMSRLCIPRHCLRPNWPTLGYGSYR